MGCPMKVRDLIAALSNVDPEREVLVAQRCGRELMDISTSSIESFRMEDWGPYYIGQPPTKLLVLVAS